MNVQLEVFKSISEGDTKAFEVIFKEYYKFLCSFAFGLTKERHSAEDIVEEFFVDLWNNREKLSISTSVRAYFISSIHNRCLNYLQRDKYKYVSACEISLLIGKEGTIGDKLISHDHPSLLTRELEKILALSIEKLPKHCKEIFQLSRFHDLGYEEIASKLDISINTVKTQIKIALSKLREDLQEYLALLLIFLLK